MTARMSPPALSFCEPVTAGPLAPWHVRSRPDGTPLKPGGGLFTTAACGRDLNGGWDIPAPGVTVETLTRLAELRDGRPGVCSHCRLEANRLLGS